MSYLKWINLFIILGLINYSYEFNLPNNQIRRHTRDVSLQSNTQNLLNKVLGDQGQLEDKIKEAIRKDEDTVKIVTQNILLAANKMAEAGSTNITSIEQWTSIQGELRTGLNVIIDAYRRYIELHRQTCDSIENFAKSIITKYETELSIVDRLTAPTSSTGNIDTTSPDFAAFMAKILQMLNYAKVHVKTLGTAIDSIGDLTQRTLGYQRAVMGPPTQTITVRITPSVSSQYVQPSFTLPCGYLSEYNGYQSCSNAIADTTRAFGTNACPQQYSQK